MGLVSSDDGWRLPDWLWARFEPLLPRRRCIRLAVTGRGFPTGTRCDRDLLSAARSVEPLRTGLHLVDRRFQVGAGFGVFEGQVD